MGRAAAHLAVVCLPRAYSLWAFYAWINTVPRRGHEVKTQRTAKYKYKSMRVALMSSAGSQFRSIAEEVSSR